MTGLSAVADRIAQPVDCCIHAGDCRWTYQQNQGVIAALKKENKEFKALLAQLPASNKSGKVRLDCIQRSRRVSILQL